MGVPIVIIAVANVTLIIRVIRQKRRCERITSWKKQRRMTIQLLSISSLYFLGWFPSMAIAVIQQLVSPTFLMEAQVDYIYDLVYLICLLLPWVCLGLFPEFTKWIWKRFLYRNVVHNTGRTRNQPK